ncbi:1566_t:CDS:2 [Cetraspora pellucida]|uniref:1566_t:CDS:1 n=1 Tax=Cetraspora pellucida TaxID=1433469 RepID=A0A9N8VWN5_9GLOM|nr:1566_t:CDS:2 [Cetraspora pellucida]
MQNIKEKSINKHISFLNSDCKIVQKSLGISKTSSKQDLVNYLVDKSKKREVSKKVLAKKNKMLFSSIDTILTLYSNADILFSEQATDSTNSPAKI